MSTIGRSDGVVATIELPKAPTALAGIIVYFQNSGHLPAKFNWGSDTAANVLDTIEGDPLAFGKKQRMFSTDNRFKPIWRARNRKTGVYETSPTILIGEGSSYQGLLWELPKPYMQQLIQSEKPFIAGGYFDYCDGLGNHICRKFYLRYWRDPYNRWSLDREDECSIGEMQLLIPNTDELEYLKPCELDENREELKFRLPYSPEP